MADKYVEKAIKAVEASEEDKVRDYSAAYFEWMGDEATINYNSHDLCSALLTISRTLKNEVVRLTAILNENEDGLGAQVSLLQNQITSERNQAQNIQRLNRLVKQSLHHQLEDAHNTSETLAKSLEEIVSIVSD